MYFHADFMKVSEEKVPALMDIWLHVVTCASSLFKEIHKQGLLSQAIVVHFDFSLMETLTLFECSFLQIMWSQSKLSELIFEVIMAIHVSPKFSF